MYAQDKEGLDSISFSIILCVINYSYRADHPTSSDLCGSLEYAVPGNCIAFTVLTC